MALNSETEKRELDVSEECNKISNLQKEVARACPELVKKQDGEVIFDSEIPDLMIPPEDSSSYEGLVSWLKENVQNEKVITILGATKNKLIERKLVATARHVSELILLRKETDATEAIVKFICENNQIYTLRHDKVSEVWIYKEGIYVPEAKTYIRELTRRLMGKDFLNRLFSEVVAKIEADTYVEEEIFFKPPNPYHLPIKNGILDLRTREIIEYSPDKFYFTKLNSRYLPDAECPNVLKFFNEVLDKGDVDVIQEMFGFTLLGEYRFEKAFMLTGSGRNGKGKTLDLLKRFIGEKFCCAIPLKSLCDENNFNIERLFSKRVNLGADISSSSLRETGMFKSLTGRDQVTVPRKYKSALTFINSAKMIFCANEIPLSSDQSFAFFNRWIVIDFNMKFVSENEMKAAKAKLDSGEITRKEFGTYKLRDSAIIERICTQQELDGLLKWALDGLDRLIEQGEFSNNKTTEQTKLTWIRKSDSFMAFCMDCLDQDYDAVITKQDLAKNYSQYCKLNGLKSRDSRWIKRILEGNYGASSAHIMYENEKKHVWQGIKLKDIRYGDKLNYQEKEDFIPPL